MATTDQISICAEALVLLGEQPIASLTGSSVGELVSSTRYGAVRNLLLARKPWKFNRRLVNIARLSDTTTAEAFGYEAGYQAPNDAWHIVAPWIDGMPFDDWAMAEGVIYLDASVNDAVWLRYHGIVDETLFTPLFREALVYWLASEFAMPVTGSEKQMQALRPEAERLLGIAGHRDASQEPTWPINTAKFKALKRR